MKSILEIKVEEIATREAEKRELQISSWIGHHWHIKKLLFGRWLFVFADMKGFKFNS